MKKFYSLIKEKITDKEIGAILKKTLSYVVSDLLNKILPFLLLPIITRYLSPSDYGTLSVFESIVAFLAVFVGLGSQEMVKVNYFTKSKETLKYYIGNVFLISLITSVLFALLFLIFKQTFINIYGLSYIWLMLAVIITFGGFYNKVISIIWIAEGDSLSFAKFQNSFTLVTLMSTILFVVILELNWQGRVYSLLISSIIFSYIAFYVIRKKDLLEVKPNLKILWKDAKEGISILPFSVSFWFKNAALLIIMASFIGKSETGIYASAMKIAIIVNIASATLNKVWQPLLFKMLSNKSGIDKVKVVKRIYSYLVILLLIGFGILIFADVIVHFALAPEFHSATKYVRYLVLGLTLQALFLPFSDFLLFFKKSKSLNFVTISGVILQYLIIAFFYLYGGLTVMDIIYSILISAFYVLLVSWYMTTLVNPLPWLYFAKIRS